MHQTLLDQPILEAYPLAFGIQLPVNLQSYLDKFV